MRALLASLIAAAASIGCVVWHLASGTPAVVGASTLRSESESTSTPDDEHDAATTNAESTWMVPTRAAEFSAAEESGDAIADAEAVTIDGREYLQLLSSSRRILFFDADALYCIEPLLDGRRHGTFRSWHENGERASVEQYDLGVLHGRAQYFDEDGDPTAEGGYRQGFKAGPWRTWHPNGQLESMGEWQPVVIDDRCVGSEQFGVWTYKFANGVTDELRSGTYLRGVKTAIAE